MVGAGAAWGIRHKCDPVRSYWSGSDARRSEPAISTHSCSSEASGNPGNSAPRFIHFRLQLCRSPTQGGGGFKWAGQTSPIRPSANRVKTLRQNLPQSYLILRPKSADSQLRGERFQMGRADFSDKTIGKSGQNLEAKSTAKFSHPCPQSCRFPTQGGRGFKWAGQTSPIRPSANRVKTLRQNLPQSFLILAPKAADSPRRGGLELSPFVTLPR